MNLFDIMILTVLLISVLAGMHKGFIMTLCGLLVTVLAFSGARIAADRLSPSVAYVLEPAVENIVHTEFQNALPDQASELEQFHWDTVDGDFWGSIVNSKLYQKTLEDFLGAARQELEQVVDNAAAVIAASLAQSLAWVLTYALAFVLIQALGNLLIRLLDLAARLPGLHALNRTLGGVCGLVKGALILAVLCSLGAGFGLIPEQSIHQSALLGVFTAFRTISQ
jgi:uncharacterized membrane protein required for colicin V production